MKQISESRFEPDWLALREPADHSARDAGLLAQAAALTGAGMTVLDLGSGTGSTARAFETVGSDALHWRFCDNDPALLRVAGARHPEATCVLQDLSRPEDLPLQDVNLITASALFDLMPLSWMEALLATAARARLPIYAALSYNGTMHWTPADVRDATITAAFNTHQRSDKGLGRALGPDATSQFEILSKTYGYHVQTAQSPWRLGAEHTALQAALVSGIAEAASSKGAQDALAWGKHRCETADESHCFIGHTDLLAVPE